jgi:hypothetical protein
LKPLAAAKQSTQLYTALSPIQGMLRLRCRWRSRSPQPDVVTDRGVGQGGRFRACGPQLAPHRIPLMPAAINIPDHVGPCEFSTLGKLVAVRCPVELAHILRRAGAIWEPGSKRWLVQRPHRAGDQGAGAHDRSAVSPAGYRAGLTGGRRCTRVPGGSIYSPHRYDRRRPGNVRGCAGKP